MVAFFSHASEADRKSAATLAVECVKREAKTPFLETKPGSYVGNPRLHAAQVAALASCSFSQLKQLGAEVRRGGADVCEALATRQPEWLDQWAEMVLKSSLGPWPTVRELVRRNCCRPPETDNYVLGMIRGVLDRNYLRGFDSQRTLADALLSDSELLECEIWRLFEVEGSGENSLAAHDKYKALPGFRWDETLALLA